LAQVFDLAATGDNAPILAFARLGYDAAVASLL
jgi:hypothetical protein